MNNDLISRISLRNEFVKYIDVFDLTAWNKINDIIDNAPTVSDRYGEGYAQGYLDGSTGADWKGGAE